MGHKKSLKAPTNLNKSCLVISACLQPIAAVVEAKQIHRFAAAQNPARQRRQPSLICRTGAETVCHLPLFGI